MRSDTIAAVATGMGHSGIGIIRISGKDALSIASAIFRPADKNSICQMLKVIRFTMAFFLTEMLLLMK